jgi:thiol-disulfide isomerase/thioredoxin
MGKASRLKEQSAREKIAAQRAAARRAERRRQLLITGTSVIGVLAIVAVFIVIKVTQGGTAKGGQSEGQTLAAVASQLSNVPAATLDKVGQGVVGTGGNGAFPNPMIKINAPPLTSGGKPEVLYMGAEYCPFCATERWAMVVALSRFGTFSGLHFIHSSPTDNPASIPTLTFYKSSYTSKYVTFTPVEEQKIDRTPLQAPTSAQQAIIAKYDNKPYVSSPGSIPFMDFGGKWIISGASYNYQDLQGQSWSQIAAALHDPSSTIAQGALGTANYFTAAICKLTNGQPGGVCGSSAVKAIEGKI